MNYAELAEIMFPDLEKTAEDYKNLYKRRQLAESLAVTRFAPSPTGFLHIGGLFAALVSYRVAKKNGGIFYLRIEDTDKKREVKDGITEIIRCLKMFGINPDEGVTGPDTEIGDYGPYIQSKRRDIYRAFAKQLVCEGKAYPCFCTEEELGAIRAEQEKNKETPGYYGEYAKCRKLSLEEAKQRIESGEPYAVRLKSSGSAERRISFKDGIRGTIEMPENVQDIVILKTDGIPTYHFAHVVDDYLMGTTHVIRGDEWISSVPIHLQLFDVLGLKPPKYAHIAPIMKEDGGGKRKLSKRKDPEAALSYYIEEGYPKESVIEYLLTIANSNYEDWRKANPKEDNFKFKFMLNKMSQSGALFDLAKLNDVSKNRISLMSAEEVYDLIFAWAKEYDAELAEMLSDKNYAVGIFSIDRYNPNPRKDIAKWSEVKEYIRYFYSSDFEYDFPQNVDKSDMVAILKAYSEVYSDVDDSTEWFEKVKGICTGLGFSPSVKDYKKQPELYKGHVGDVSTVIRVAVTGRRNTPDLWAIMRLLGKDEVLRRMDKCIRILEEK